MTATKDEIRLSKYLSKILRHTPEAVGLALEPGGWVRVDDLLAACKRHGTPITYEQLRAIVAGSDKQRFAFDLTGRPRIRANQGHSVDVDLQLTSAVPPDLLYHGTSCDAVSSIFRDGLQKMSRHHVHLSADEETAWKVGARHGRPALFGVNGAAMHAAGIVFYVSANGVWLVDAVPPEYLERRYIGE